MKTASEVAADFDRIAACLTVRAPSRLSALELSLLECAPRVGRALDLGCGTGEATRFLARRGLDVVGIDVSPRMIERARAEHNPPSASFALAEALAFLDRSQAFDCLVAIGVLHHFDTDAVAARIQGALRPGGILLVLDLVDRRAARYLALNACARAVRLWQAHRTPTRQSLALRQAWRDHGASETYLTPDQARRLAQSRFPGGEFRHHLPWRYSIRWRKPRAAAPG